MVLRTLSRIGDGGIRVVGMDRGLRLYHIITHVKADVKQQKMKVASLEE